MLEIIIESIASTLAEALAGQMAAKGTSKLGKAAGWVNLAILLACIAFLVWMGLYLARTGVLWAAILLLAIAAFIALISGWRIVATIRSKRKS